MIASTGATFTAWVALVIIFGSMSVWVWFHWREDRRQTERERMRSWAEPSRLNRGHDYHRADVLEERPLLPDDYREWGSTT